MRESFWHGRLSWKDFFKTVYREYNHDNVADTAAVLGYYFVYSLFPFLFFLATLGAYIPHVQSSMGTLLARAHALLPAQAMDIIEKNVHAVLGKPRPRLLTIGLVGTLYSASRGVDAVRKALNLAYDVKESRAMWKTELLAFGMTMGSAALVLFGIAGLIAGGDVGLWLAGKLDIAPVYAIVWTWLRWPVTALLVMSCAAIGYYVLPDVEQEFRFITPGSIVGTLVWLVATWGFSVYAGHFGSYNVTFGSIGGVVLLMTWFYITGFIFIMGGEINAILEAASDEGKASGARAPGEAPPPPSQRPSAMPPGAAKRAEVAEATAGGAAPPPGAPSPDTPIAPYPPAQDHAR
ncbi:MAG TPA: YihY/virulence factor BrkB family protein [Polyangia bacterium]|nr:YihY/virulence factor BrkB family protein [Polyangia bacterium]